MWTFIAKPPGGLQLTNQYKTEKDSSNFVSNP